MNILWVGRDYGIVNGDVYTREEIEQMEGYDETIQ